MLFRSSYSFKYINGRNVFPAGDYTLFNQIPESDANYRLIINYINKGVLVAIRNRGGTLSPSRLGLDTRFAAGLSDARAAQLGTSELRSLFSGVLGLRVLAPYKTASPGEYERTSSGKIQPPATQPQEAFYQSFFVTESTGFFATSLDLYFQTKSKTDPVAVSIVKIGRAHV